MQAKFNYSCILAVSPKVFSRKKEPYFEDFFCFKNRHTQMFLPNISRFFGRTRKFLPLK